MADTTSARRGARLRTAILVVLAIGLLLFATAQRVADWRRATVLRQASLLELGEMASRDPEQYDVQHSLAVRAATENRHDVALDAFWRAVQARPDSEVDWLGWCESARRVKGPQAADRILEDYLKTRPDSSQAWLARARLYRSMGYHRTSFEYAQKVVALQPNLVEGWGLMAEQAREQKDYATAMQAANHAVALAPGDWRAHLEVGRILREGRRTSESVEPLRRAVSLAPQMPTANMHLGLALVEVARTAPDFEEARSYLRRALDQSSQLHPHDVFTISATLGQSYLRESRGREALGPLQRAEQLEPGNELIHYSLAQAYRSIGNTAAAKRETQIHQGIARYHAGIRYLLLQIAGEPSNPEHRLKLARLYLSRGNTVDAAETYRNMIAKNVGAPIARRELDRMHVPNADPTGTGPAIQVDQRQSR